MSTERTPLTIEDLYRLGWVEEPAVSPDGRMVAYVRVSVDRASNRYRRSIWTAPIDGGRPRKLTSGARSDSAPRWSPDGRTLAFVSNRDDQPQIYLIPVDGGEARRLTSHPQGASDPAWSPSGRQIAFIARTTPEERAREDSGDAPAPPADEIERRHRRERSAQDEAARVDPRVVTRLPYRGGTSYFDGRQRHLYVADVPESDDDEIAPARRVTDGDLHFGPPAWSADGGSLLSAHGRDPEADTLFGFDDIVRIPLPAEGRAAPLRLTGPGFSYSDPRVSPDGRWIAARRRDEGRPLARGAAVVVIPAEGGAELALTAHTDLNIELFRWSAASDALLCTAGWWGEQPIYRAPIDLRGEPLAAAVPAEGRVISELDVGLDGIIAYIAGDAANPCELYVRGSDGSERCLTDVSARLLGERVVAPIEELRYPAPDGQIVQGWVIYPPGYDPATPAPLAVHIHGGPHLMWGPGVRNMWHELQVNAARGYITFFCNPRGSDGYGEAWRDGVHGDWGCAGADILAGVDLLVARGHIDTARIAVTGGSYGGYMTAWLIAHDKRFVCAVSARGVYDLISFHGTSDAHELIECEFDALPWTGRDLLWAQSPLAHADRIDTPLLILHAELDWRVPISQAEQLFSNLRRRRVRTELVRYPREGHELTRAGEPDHRADHMQRTLAWFDHYCAR